MTDAARAEMALVDLFRALTDRSMELPPGIAAVLYANLWNLYGDAQDGATKSGRELDAMDKPIHVQLAEALGWQWRVSPSGKCRWLGPPDSDTASDFPDHPKAEGQERMCVDAYRHVPRYDTDWKATGPFIEKYGIELMEGRYGWYASANGVYGEGHDTPLLAICAAVLALKEAGKL